MKKLLATLLLSFAIIAQAQVNHLVISQVYSGGGNSGAPFTHDFVELYNPTATAISLSGMSIQYAGAGTNNWSSNQFNLSGSVAPGRYFLIQFGSTTSTSNLPRPDLKSNSLTLSTASGKVALIDNTTTLTGNCPLPANAIIDFVGYGSADCFETAAASSPSNTTSISRMERGCMDANNNSTDFVVTIPSPRNSTSDGHTCNGGSIAITRVIPDPFCVTTTQPATGNVAFSATGTFSNSTFNAYLSSSNGSFAAPVLVGSSTVTGSNPSGNITVTIPAATASSTAYRLEIHSTTPALLSAMSDTFEIVNGVKNVALNEFFAGANNNAIALRWTNPSGCFDDVLIVAKEGSSITGTPTGDGTAYSADLNFDGNGTTFNGGKVVYKGSTSPQTVTGLTNGTTYYFKIFTRRGTIWSSGTEINDHPRRVPLPGEILIDQLSTGYNTSLDEYIQLVNTTALAFDLSDCIIDIASDTGAHVVAGGLLSGTLPPHGYYLILPKNTTTITAGKTISLPRDLGIDLGFGASKTQIGLIRKTDSLAIDAVTYGTVQKPIYVEGTATANPPSKGGLRRVVTGVDHNNNSTDFVGVANADIELRNSASRLSAAGVSIPAGTYSDLVVTGNSSPGGNITLDGKLVFVSGIYSLNDFNLSMLASSGGRNDRYVQTNGTGALTITNVTTDVVFPVGNSTYNPVTINNSNGLSWRVAVADVIAPTPTPFQKEAAIQRTWNIAPSETPSSGATVVFEYDDKDGTQVGSRFNDEKTVQVWNYHTAGWQSITNPQMPVSVPGRKAVTVTNYKFFSPFVIANATTALPVHFVQFSARVQPGGVQLQFTNATEKDVLYYVIERSANGRDFEALAQLPPTSNNGAATYRWLDKTPLSGNGWYRVKSVETNGTLTYTQVLQVAIGHEIKQLTIYPNPVQGRSIVWQATLPHGAYQLRLYGNNGQQVLLQHFKYSGGNYTETLELPANLPAGVYRLHVQSNKFVRQQTFVVL